MNTSAAAAVAFDPNLQVRRRRPCALWPNVACTAVARPTATAGQRSARARVHCGSGRILGPSDCTLHAVESHDALGRAQRGWAHTDARGGICHGRFVELDPERVYARHTDLEPREVSAGGGSAIALHLQAASTLRTIGRRRRPRHARSASTSSPSAAPATWTGGSGAGSQHAAQRSNATRRHLDSRRRCGAHTAEERRHDQGCVLERRADARHVRRLGDRTVQRRSAELIARVGDQPQPHGTALARAQLDGPIAGVDKAPARGPGSAAHFPLRASGAANNLGPVRPRCRCAQRCAQRRRGSCVGKRGRASRARW